MLRFCTVDAWYPEAMLTPAASEVTEFTAVVVAVFAADSSPTSAANSGPR